MKWRNWGTLRGNAGGATNCHGMVAFGTRPLVFMWLLHQIHPEQTYWPICPTCLYYSRPFSPNLSQNVEEGSHVPILKYFLFQVNFPCRLPNVGSSSLAVVHLAFFQLTMLHTYADVPVCKPAQSVAPHLVDSFPFIFLGHLNLSIGSPILGTAADLLHFKTLKLIEYSNEESEPAPTSAPCT